MLLIRIMKLKISIIADISLSPQKDKSKSFAYLTTYFLKLIYAGDALTFIIIAIKILS